MWPLKKPYKDQLKKQKVEIKPCLICNSDAVFGVQPDTYFNYHFKICCTKCRFEFTKYGNPDEAYTPENYKNDWDNFINSWNNVRNKK